MGGVGHGRWSWSWKVRPAVQGVHSDLAEVMKAAEAHEGQGVQKIFGGERWAGGSGPSEVQKKPAESCTACWPGTLGKRPRRLF